MGIVRPTKKQRELLSFIDGFICGHGYGPSYREIMRSLNYKSVSTVATHIDNLIAKGHLRKRDKSARSLEVVKDISSNIPVKLELQTKMSAQHEKWLTDCIDQRLKKVESKKTITTDDLDQLYILVGALQVLGFEDVAKEFKLRLIALK
ncbi:MAG: hypothetical protein PVI21_02460 [Candidatus Woesebacteria bacterium]